MGKNPSSFKGKNNSLGELAFKPFFDRMRSLIITSEGVENGVGEATIFVTF